MHVVLFFNVFPVPELALTGDKYRAGYIYHHHHHRTLDYSSWERFPEHVSYAWYIAYFCCITGEEIVLQSTMKRYIASWRNYDIM